MNIILVYDGATGMFFIQNITVNIINDTTMEAPEEFLLALARSTFPSLPFNLAPANATITIIDDDGLLLS